MDRFWSIEYLLNWVELAMCYLHLSLYFGIPGHSHSWFVPENRELGFKGLSLEVAATVMAKVSRILMGFDPGTLEVTGIQS
jgi:hypothetical protein